MHDIARIDQPQARPSVDGRGDPGVIELRAGVVDLRLIDLQLRRQLIHHGALRVHGLLAREVLRLQHRIALEIALRVRELRRVLRLGRNRLLERGLVRPRIDLRQQVALVHRLALGESDLLQLAVHARRHGNGIERLDRPQALQVDRHIGLGRLNDIHGDGLGGLVGRRGGALVPGVEPERDGDGRQDGA